jgi:hypothetical protein
VWGKEHTGVSAAFAADGDSGVSASEEGTFTVITCSFLKKILDPTYQIVKDLGRLNLTDTPSCCCCRASSS